MDFKVLLQAVCAVAVLSGVFAVPSADSWLGHRRKNTTKRPWVPQHIKYIKTFRTIGDILVKFRENPEKLFTVSTYQNYSMTCVKDLLVYAKGMASNKAWALRMWDAWGRMEAGIMNGRTTWLGDFDSCQRVGRMGGNGGPPFKGKYCKALFQTDGTETGFGMCIPDSCTTDDIYSIFMMALSERKSTHNITLEATYSFCVEEHLFWQDPGAVITTVIIVIFGCMVTAGTVYDYMKKKPQKEKIPKKKKSKKEKTIAKSGKDNKGYLPDSENPSDKDSVQLKVYKLSTPDVERTTYLSPPGHPTTLRRRSLPFTESKIAPPFVTVLPTDVAEPKEDAPSIKPPEEGALGKIALSFSLLTNVPRLVTTRGATGGFTCLNGMRVLSMLWVIVGHAWVYGTVPLGIITVGNKLDFLKNEERITQGVIANMPLAVDTFFCLSGMLVTISFLKQLAGSKGKVTGRMMGLFYFHRIWRLSPVYFATLAIYANYFKYLGQGPNYQPNWPELANCKTSWWKNILYVNNLIDPEKECMGWAWYLANDFQFYIISPLFIFPLFKKPIVGFSLISLVFTGSLSITLYLWLKVTLYPTGYAGDFEWYYTIYVRPWCRIGTFLMGMCLGYIIWKTKNKIQLHRATVIAGWISAIVLCLVVVYLPQIEKCEGCPEVPVIAGVIYNSVKRQLFTLCVCWIVLACTTGNGGIINTLLSLKYWMPFVRLCYAMYLVHPIIIHYTYFSSSKMWQWTDWLYVYFCCGHFVLSTVFGAVLSLVFEVPMLGVEKVLIPRRH